MPDKTLKEIEVIIDEPSSKDDTDLIARRILSNLEGIKSLEADNKRLRELFVSNQESVKKLKDEKINRLVNILNHKELQFKSYQEKIKKDFDRIVDILNSRLSQEKEKVRYYEGLLPLLRQARDENLVLRKELARVRYLLKKDYEKKVLGITDEMRLMHHKSQGILKEHELAKLGFEQSLVQEQEKNMKLVARIKEIEETLQRTQEDAFGLKKLAKELAVKLNYVNSHSLGNERLFQEKIISMRKELEDKTREIAKGFLDKEIEYRARNESLTNDMRRYYLELKKLKEKYYSREKELKEKISQISQVI